jgi:hypothetical protein
MGFVGYCLCLVWILKGKFGLLSSSFRVKC